MACKQGPQISQSQFAQVQTPLQDSATQGKTMAGALTGAGQRASARPVRTVGGSFPTSVYHIGPLGYEKQGACNHCCVAAHEYFECPVKLYAVFGFCMPGFDQSGQRLSGYWHLNDQKQGPSQEVAAA